MEINNLNIDFIDPYRELILFRSESHSIVEKSN